jgi:hypothetical protein
LLGSLCIASNHKRTPRPPARETHPIDGGHISPIHAKRAASPAIRSIVLWMGDSLEEVRQLSRSSVYARLAGTARYFVAFRCPHLLHFQPLITRTRPRRSSNRGRRTQRVWVWRVCSLHRVQWIIRVSTSPIGGTLYHGLVGWQYHELTHEEDAGRVPSLRWTLILTTVPSSLTTNCIATACRRSPSPAVGWQEERQPLRRAEELVCRAACGRLLPL